MSEFWAAIAGGIIGGVFAVTAAYLTARLTFSNERTARADERLDEALWRACRLAGDMAGLNGAGSLISPEALQLLPQLNTALVEIQSRCTTKQAALAITLDGLRRGIAETISNAREAGTWTEPDRAAAREYLEALGRAATSWTDNAGKFIKDGTTSDSLLQIVRAREQVRAASALPKP